VDLYRHHRQRGGIERGANRHGAGGGDGVRHYRRGRAALRGTRRPDRIPVWLGYGLLILSIVLLVSHPLLVRFALAALLFKFTWTFVLPFILARVAGLDNNGRLMNSINLVIGGGMAAGPALAGALLQRFSSADALLAAAGGCALISAGLILAASSAGKEPTGG
jgi:predicted MFS family arabinose efflux permease